MNLTSNYYGDVKLKLLGFTFILTSAFTCAWRDLNVFIGQFSLLWIQLSFWAEQSSLPKGPNVAGIRLRLCIFRKQVFHHTILPLTNWHWHYKHPWRRKYLGWILDPWNHLIWKIAKRFVDRRYNKAWDEFKKADARRWFGIKGNGLLEFKPSC